MTAVVFTTLGVNHLIDILDPGSTASSPPSWYIGWGTGGSGTGGTATEGDVDLFAGATNSEGNGLGRATATVPHSGQRGVRSPSRLYPQFRQTWPSFAFGSGFSVKRELEMPTRSS